MKEFIKLSSLFMFGFAEIACLEYSGINKGFGESVFYGSFLGWPAIAVWLYFVNWIEGY